MRGRIRTVKPELFTDEKLWDLGAQTSLPVLQAFVGLWCFADREGRFDWRPRALKTSILPYWEGDFEHVLDALASADLLVRYEANGKAYGYVTNFLKHQLINQREAKSEIPAPGSQCTHVRTRVPENIAEPVRATVLARDKVCVRCSSADDLTVDHIFPRCLGGTHAVTNLRILCRSCNSARPVSGEALLSDLAKDGLTMSDMQRMCMHVQSRGEGNGNGNGKGREGSGNLARARVREGDPPPEWDAQAFAASVPTRFRKLYLERFQVDVAVGGANVGSFPERLRTTAEAQQLEPLVLLERLFAAWCDQGRPGVDKQIPPYSAFIARFDALAAPALAKVAETPQHELAALRKQHKALCERGEFGDPLTEVVRQIQQLEKDLETPRGGEPRRAFGR